MRQDVFEKVICRLCETGELHKTESSNGLSKCAYWLEGDGGRHEITGFVEGSEFWLPVRYCPFCGKEL